MIYKIVSVLCFLLALSTDSFANGAAFWPEIGGGNITLYDGNPAQSLIVDEFVDIDFSTGKVRVSYVMENLSGQPVRLPMAFPVTHSNSVCEAFSYDEQLTVTIADAVLLDDFGFKAMLNGQMLQTKYNPVSDVDLPKGFSGLERLACAFYTFNALLVPGHNELVISHNFKVARIMADGAGDSIDFTYPIWPAKNWVTKFRVAKWRIGYSSKSTRDNNVAYGECPNIGLAHGWAEFDVSAPGEKFCGENEYIFTATNYLPSGSVRVHASNPGVSDSVVGCDEDKLPTCWQDSFRSLLNGKKYHGGDRCYSIEDLSSVLINRGDVNYVEFYPDALPYFRNEIFARHGYAFTSPEYRGFFGSLDWYFPTGKSVEINEVEKFNIKYIQAAKEHASRIYMDYITDFESEALKKEREEICE